jgi:hypothetical protein
MRKAFWEGFRTGFITASKYSIPIAAVFVLGLYLGSASHPFEVCKKQYETQEDISECVWIMENR